MGVAKGEFQFRDSGPTKAKPGRDFHRAARRFQSRFQIRWLLRIRAREVFSSQSRHAYLWKWFPGDNRYDLAQSVSLRHSRTHARQKRIGFVHLADRKQERRIINAFDIALRRTTRGIIIQS